MRVVRAILMVGFVFLTLILIAGYMGALHPVGDSLALLRVPLACLGLSAVLVLRPIKIGVVISLFCLSILALYWTDRARDTGPKGPYVLYQKNLRFTNDQIDLIAADIIAQDADFVTLQEVSTVTAPILDLLAEQYPHRILCKFASVGGVAVLSKLPVVKASNTCWDRNAGAAALAVDTPDGWIWIVSVHLYWPYPSGQADQVDYLTRALDGFHAPVILGGDFNMFANTRVTRAITNIVGGQELRPLHTTFERHGIEITIDHVIAPSGRLKQRPRFGSDHYGIVAYVDRVAQ